MTNDGTAISSSANTDNNGQYVFNGLRPATCSVNVEAIGFQETVQRNIVLADAQQATLDFALKPYSFHESVTVYRHRAAARYDRGLDGDRGHE